MPRPPQAVSVDPTIATPFLVDVDPMAAAHYKVWHVPYDDTTAATSLRPTPATSFREVQFPLATNNTVRTAVSDVGSWSTFRLSKFYEMVDVLTGDVVYDYTQQSSQSKNIAWVTAGHYHSRKLRRTDLTRNINLRTYITKVGRSSMEIRSDAWQDERLVNVCHTIMVALDPTTMKPLVVRSKTSDGHSQSDHSILPPLHTDPHDAKNQAERLAMAEWHDQIRKARAASSLQLRTPISTPPTPTEVQAIHQLHQQVTRLRESSGNQPGCPPNVHPRTVGAYTFRSSAVIFPEHRNVHGKLFGGYVLSEAYNLALYATKFFAQSGQSDVHKVVPLGLDEAIFHQPVSIGDLVSFTARVVHATRYTCRVVCTVKVLDPTCPTRSPSRSNRLTFVFAATTPLEHKTAPFVVPETYPEVLLHVEAARRHAVEGPTEDEARVILEQAAQ